MDARPPHIPADVRAVGAAGVSAREVTELRFAVQPGLQVRAHVDYRLVAGVFTAAKREGRTARVYVIDGAGMLSAASLERQLAECGADVHIALSSIDMCRATALDGMLVCLQRVSALIRARPNLYALVLVYGLSQLVPAHRTATNVQEFVNCVMQLGVLSREGNVAVVSCNACFELPQGFVYAGLAPQDAPGADLASAGSANIVQIRTNGDVKLVRRRFVDTV